MIKKNEGAVIFFCSQPYRHLRLPLSLAWRLLPLSKQLTLWDFLSFLFPLQSGLGVETALWLLPDLSLSLRHPAYDLIINVFTYKSSSNIPNLNMPSFPIWNLIHIITFKNLIKDVSQNLISIAYWWDLKSLERNIKNTILQKKIILKLFLVRLL